MCLCLCNFSDTIPPILFVFTNPSLCPALTSLSPITPLEHHDMICVQFRKRSSVLTAVYIRATCRTFRALVNSQQISSTPTIKLHLPTKAPIFCSQPQQSFATDHSTAHHRDIVTHTHKNTTQWDPEDTTVERQSFRRRGVCTRSSTPRKPSHTQAQPLAFWPRMASCWQPSERSPPSCWNRTHPPRKCTL